MGAVCDVYDAITSNRPYKAGWDPAESLRKMAEWANGHFDPTVFQAFVKSLGIYPIGSLVKLSSGRWGSSSSSRRKSLLTPSIKVFFSTRSNARIRPRSTSAALSEETPALILSVAEQCQREQSGEPVGLDHLSPRLRRRRRDRSRSSARASKALRRQRESSGKMARKISSST
jgi:hypothetical protein